MKKSRPSEPEIATWAAFAPLRVMVQDLVDLSGDASRAWAAVLRLTLDARADCWTASARGREPNSGLRNVIRRRNDSRRGHIPP